MGTDISVASSLQNLMSKKDQQSNYMSQMVLGKVLGGSSKSLSDTIVEGTIRGPAGNLNRFYNWAGDNYTKVGVPQGSFLEVPELSESVILAQVPKPSGYTTKMVVSKFGGADYLMWASRYICDTHVGLFNTDWTAVLNSSTGAITITYEDASTEVFTPSDMDVLGTYVYAIYTQAITSSTPSWSEPLVWIYKIGSGNAALDDLVIESSAADNFYYPFIPIRIDNQFVGDMGDDDLTAQVTTALKKSVGASYTDLVAQISESPSLGDIDYSYIAFGVPANTKTKSGLAYLYAFFDRAYTLTSQTGTDADAYQAAITAYNNKMVIYNTWLAAQDSIGDPLYGTPAPEYPVFPPSGGNSIRIKSTSMPSANYDMEISWSSLTKMSGTEYPTIDGFPLGLKAGDYYFGRGGDEVADREVPILGAHTSADLIKSIAMLNLSKCRLYKMTSDTSWECLEFIDCVHRNYIYAGHSVVTNLIAALDNTTSDSGFLVPLHRGTTKDIGLAAFNQLMTSCAFIVHNCYVVVHTSFLESLIAIVISIVVIVIVVMYAPYLAPQLSTTITAIAAAVGVTGIAGIILAATIYSIGTMITAQLVTAGMQAAFGDKVGLIISTILTLAYSAYQAGVSFENLHQVFTYLAQPENLAKITMAGLDTYSGITAIETKETYIKTQEMMDTFSKQLAEVEKKYADVIGYGSGNIDPTMFIDALKPLIETPENFLTRTLLNGTDIAELSQAMIDSFSEITLSTRLAGV